MNKQPLIVAHRGFAAHHTASTIAAFQAAITAGADMIELDIHETADGKYIVHHDNHLPNTPPWHTLSYSQVNQSTKPTGIAPLLSDCIRVITPTSMNIEIKTCQHPENFITTISQTSLPPGSLISSFNPHILKSLHQQHIQIPLFLIMSISNRRSLTHNLRNILFYLFPNLLPHYLVGVSIPYSLATRSFTNRLNKLHKHIHVWAVNQPHQMKKAVKLPIQAIITDNPPLLKQMVDR